MKTLVRSAFQTRPLAARDLPPLVAIDAALSARVRRAYFERRLAAAKRDPDRHLQLAVDEDGALAGFILGRLIEGEFGRTEAEVRMESFGVKASAQRRGLGAALCSGFEKEAARRGVSQVRTAALWREHELLRFLDHAGYRLAGNHVLDCTLGDVELGSPREQPVGEAPAEGFERLARDAVQVGLLQQADLEGVARIDLRLTGRQRRGYLCRSFSEALVDSALRVSLAAHADGAVAGYLMARLDYGDFGRAEPVAVIDTLGVDPLRARQGIGRALLSQLFVNLSALRVERVETVVAPGNLDLMGFFYAAGLRPAERLSFLKRL
jgi:ribosomal protein S18 acetylase RimI-like enzyme